MTETYTYDAFGTLTYIQSLNEEGVLAQTDTALSRFLYAGEQYDEVSGLYYLRARRYDTTVGRFTQEDTYLGDGRNLYVYVQNNPLKYVDPSGYSTKNLGYESTDLQKMQDAAYYYADGPAAMAGVFLGPIYSEALREAEPIDHVQTGLDAVGLFPFLGEPADLANGYISWKRGNYFNAVMSVGAAIPVAGILSTGAKGVKKAVSPVVKVIKEMLGSLKYLDEANDGRKALEAAIEIGTDALQYADELAEAVGKGGSAFGRNLVDNMDEIAEDIININKQYSDGFELNNSIKNILNSASYYDDPYEQVAAVTRSITDHAFANGNKRTALDTLNMLIDDLGLDDVLTDSQKWDLIYDIAEGRLDDVTEIARILKGK